MKCFMELNKQLINELDNLWVEVKIKNDKIETLIKQIKEPEKLLMVDFLKRKMLRKLYKGNINGQKKRKGKAKKIY